MRQKRWRWFLFILTGVCFFSGIARGEDRTYSDQLKPYKKLYHNYNERDRQVKTLQQEVDRLKNKRDAVRQRADKIKAQFSKPQEESDRLKREVSARQEEIRKLERQAVLLNSAFWQKQEGYGETQAEIKVINQRQAALFQEVQDLEEQKGRLTAKMGRLKNQHSQVRGRLDRLQQEVRKKEKSLAAMAAPLSSNELTPIAGERETK